MRSEQIRIGLLGTLKVTYTSEVTRHRSLQITAAKQRQVLAMLAANANTTVSTDQLIDELWPSDPPSTVKTIVQTYVY
jgi:DNA-binding SARP family transcriptional activator